MNFAQVDSNGQPVNIRFGGCESPPPQVCPVDEAPPQNAAASGNALSDQNNGQCSVGYFLLYRGTANLQDHEGCRCETSSL